MRRILFTGGGGAAAESIYAQWRERYSLFFGDADPTAVSPVIPAERVVALPFAREPGFASRVQAISKELALDMVIPGVDEELPALAALAGEASPQILLPDRPFVVGMMDKLRAAELIAAAGLAVPRTLPLARAAELDFPIIAKPRSGRGSRGVMVLESPAQATAYLALNAAHPPDAFIAQDRIVGQEYTVFVAADRAGRLAAVVPIKVLIKRGITLRAEIDAAPEILAYVSEFQARLRPIGVYNVQLMLTPNREVYPFEVNPRVSTTFCLAIATGFDPVASFMEGHQGDVFVPQQRFSLQRSWMNAIREIR